MNFTVLDQYNSFVENHFINKDSQQIDVLQKIYNAWSNNKQKNYFFKQKKTKVFFIDELHIFNIVDALIVKKLFVLFDKYKLFVLVSSNLHPQNLYADGLQRSDFIPFIDFILNNFELIQLDNSKDYRRLTLNQSKTYFTPINNETNEEFNKLFERFVDKTLLDSQQIKIKSREIIFDKCSANVAL